MNMTKKDLDAFAREELKKRRFTYTGWRLTNDTLEAHCACDTLTNCILIRSPRPEDLNDKALISLSKRAIRRAWWSLVDWVLLEDGALQINHKNKDGHTGAITVDLPRDKPQAPPVVDDEPAEGND